MKVPVMNIPYLILWFLTCSSHCMDWHRLTNGSIKQCLFSHTPQPTSLSPTISMATECVLDFWFPCQQIYKDCHHVTNFPCGRLTDPSTSDCSSIVWKIRVSLKCLVKYIGKQDAFFLVLTVSIN